MSIEKHCRGRANSLVLMFNRSKINGLCVPYVFVCNSFVLLLKAVLATVDKMRQ